MFPPAAGAGVFNVPGSANYLGAGARVGTWGLATSSFSGSLRTLFRSLHPNQNSIFGAAPNGTAVVAAIQVYSTDQLGFEGFGYRYGDLRITPGFIQLTAAALGPGGNNLIGAGPPQSWPLRFFVVGRAHVVGIDGSWSFNNGQAILDTNGNLGLGNVTPAARLQLGQGGALQFDRPDGTNQFRNSYIANDLNLVWTFNAGANIMKLQNDGTLIVNALITAALTASSLTLGGTSIAGSGNNAVPQRIAQVVCAGSQATVDFPSIPPGFSALLILSQSRDTTAGTSDSNVFMRFNGDATSGNYDAPEAIAVTGTSVAGAQPASTTNGMVILTHPNNGASAGRAAIGRIEIPNYAGGFFKQAMGQSYDPFGTTATTVSMYLRGGQWRSAAAINRITLTAGTAFLDNSVFTLLGIP